MGRKNQREVIAVIPADMLFEVEKPRFNPFQSGHGAHRNRKAYDRKRKHRGQEVD